MGSVEFGSFHVLPDEPGSPAETVPSSPADCDAAACAAVVAGESSTSSAAGRGPPPDCCAASLTGGTCETTSSSAFRKMVNWKDSPGSPRTVSGLLDSAPGRPGGSGWLQACTMLSGLYWNTVMTGTGGHVAR